LPQRAKGEDREGAKSAKRERKGRLSSRSLRVLDVFAVQTESRFSWQAAPTVRFLSS
jgi:hypothetical protein